MGEGGDYALSVGNESSPSPGQQKSLDRQSCGLCPALPSRQPDIAGNFTEPGCQRSCGSVQRRGPASSCAVSPTQEDAPSLLVVLSPNLLKTCAGCYVQEACASANGQPLWKHKRRAFWLFSTPKGRWAIGGADVRDGGFARNSGWIYQECYHGGVMPDRCSSGWLLFNGEEDAFISDETFAVTTPIGNWEGSSIFLAPGSSCKVLPKSLTQQASCETRIFIGTLQPLFKWCREAMMTLRIENIGKRRFRRTAFNVKRSPESPTCT